MRLLPRISVLFETAVRMALHDRMKLAGALLGVVFATFLGGQQLGIFLGLVQKNTLLADDDRQVVATRRTQGWGLPAPAPSRRGGPPRRPTPRRPARRWRCAAARRHR